MFSIRWFASLLIVAGLFFLSSASAQYPQHFPNRSTNAWNPVNAQLRSPFWNRRILPETPISYGYSRYPRPNYRNGWLSNQPNNGWGGTGYHPAPLRTGQSQGGWLPGR